MKSYKTKLYKLDDLKPHPKNYREHPEDQLEHIQKSIEQHGFYRNIVITKDGTILAGHGVAKACRRMKMEKIPVVILDIDPNSSQALKVIAGDNEISHLGEVNDRMLTNLLKEIQEYDEDGLLGTGYDEMMLANLLFVSRPKTEIENMDHAEEWVGMPDFSGTTPYSSKVTVEFRSEQYRERFFKLVDAVQHSHRKSFLWPAVVEKDDPINVRFESDE